MSKIDSVVDRLKYIAQSPRPEHGGFHPEAVRTAKDTLRLIAQLRKAAKR